MTSWMLEGDGGRIHRDAYEKLGVAGIPCGMQGAKGGGWFRGELNTVADFKGQRLRFGKLCRRGRAAARRHGGAAAAGRVLLQAAAGQGRRRRDVDAGHRCGARLRQARPALLHAGLAAALGGARLPDAQGQVGGAAAAQRAPDRDRLPRQHRLDAEPLAAHSRALALEKLQASGVVIKQWSPELLEAFREKSEIVLKEQAERDADFAAALANQRDFIAQGIDWRTLSRLPSSQRNTHRERLKGRLHLVCHFRRALRASCTALRSCTDAPSGQFDPDMTILSSQVDTRSDTFKRNAEAMRALVDDLKGRTDKVRLGGGEESRKRHVVARQAAAARAGAGAARSRLAVPRAVAAGGDGHVRQRGAGLGRHHRHRPGERRRMRDRLQRRHGEGRHLLSDDGEEASPRPGSGDGEPAALHLPGRFRRRQPAAMARGVPRQEPFRPHLLQPGQHVGAGHPADRRRSWARAPRAAPTCRR